MKRSKISATFVLGILVFAAHAQEPAKEPDIASTPTAPSAFAGRWSNQNPQTSGITRVRLQAGDSAILAHMWGKCHPNDCDWGEASARATDGELNIRWDHGFAVRDQQLKILSDGRLQVTTHTHFVDESGRADNTRTEYFVRE